uniref:Uncharacterized protein LOC113797284 n=1 Tax=Dermatophagoides pteronyssinus TaxID=6956 RepID=A0A6P6YEX0_DERPT|nr:uncharacterized protein LOC113797284 [Dermatophagoides pteronyssinus]
MKIFIMNDPNECLVCLFAFIFESSWKMALPSNMIFLYIFNFILMTISEIRTNNEMITTATQKDHICESLKNNNSTEFHIVAIGTTSKRILVIANQSFVYDVRINSLDEAHDKLHLPTK